MTSSPPASTIEHRLPAGKCEYLFVYGTLMRGNRNRFAARLHRTGKYVSRAELRGRLYTLGSFPGAAPDLYKSDKIFGEVFRLPPRPDVLFEALDRYEGCHPSSPQPHVFRKETAIAELASGKLLKVLIYSYARRVERLARIHSGRFALKSKRLK